MKTQKEEPLALQKLMLRHLRTIGESRVITVKENDALKDLDGATQRLLQSIIYDGKRSRR